MLIIALAVFACLFLMSGKRGVDNRGLSAAILIPAIAIEALFPMATLTIGIVQSVIAKKIGKTVGNLKSNTIVIIQSILLGLGLITAAMGCWAIYNLHSVPIEIEVSEIIQVGVFIGLPGVFQLGAAIFNIVAIKKNKK